MMRIATASRTTTGANVNGVKAAGPPARIHPRDLPYLRLLSVVLNRPLGELARSIPPRCRHLDR